MNAFNSLPPADEARHPDALRQALAARLATLTGKPVSEATITDWYASLAAETRAALARRWADSRARRRTSGDRQVYYLSMEFLIGRMLTNSLAHLDLEPAAAEALAALGVELEALREQEPDAALGNGGLGRLAACYLDSMAHLGLDGHGYGLRYNYGMFTQRIEAGRQKEYPDEWLSHGNPWEFARPDVRWPVRFGGGVRYDEASGGWRWDSAETVVAVAFDTPVPGRNGQVNTLRLWSARAPQELDLGAFNDGDHDDAVLRRNRCEQLTHVLYPGDHSDAGRELRLRQEYFLVSATIQDILSRQNPAADAGTLAGRLAIQLNDTHPALAIPELMRLLLDERRLSWDEAWAATCGVFSYTNHTLMPEALETWDAALLETLLPRHMQIIREIDRRLREAVARRHADDAGMAARMAILSDGDAPRVRMAHLAIAGSRRVNGVARIHTDLMRQTIFADFARFEPDKFVSVTNGVTPRLWLQQANPALSALITRHIGGGWMDDLTQLRRLAALADSDAFQEAFTAVKRAAKARLAAHVGETLGIAVSADSLFDVQIKRLHEYKRQLLNVLHVITLYERIRAGATPPPRTVIFAGKAAPSYFMAKLVIQLIHDVARRVNSDPLVGDRLKVVFIPNYGVSAAMRIIPAADLSEQISTAGTEASGTGNMKLALNGALTIGTLDGANVEMAEQIGAEHLFIFGLTADEVRSVRDEGYAPQAIYDQWPRVRRALDLIGGGFFSPEEPGRYRPLFESLTGHDHYLLLADYSAYVSKQEEVAELWQQPAQWARKAILNIAGMGYFSSDRAIGEYARDIWRVG